MNSTTGESGELFPEAKAPLATPKLCGRLTCRKQTGLLKTYESRWFVYSEETGNLLYYKTPDDLLPLGEIDIKRATFGFAVGERPGVFQIRTSDRLYILEAESRSAMMSWLQEMQAKRMEYFQKNPTHASRPKGNLGGSSSSGSSSSGGTDGGGASEEPEREKFPPIAVPLDDLGQPATEQTTLQKRMAARLSALFQMKKSECESCKLLQQSLTMALEESSNLRRELATSKEVNRLLHAKLDKLSARKSAEMDASHPTDLPAASDLAARCRELEFEVEALTDQNGMMSETVAAKDDVIVSLSRQLDEVTNSLSSENQPQQRVAGQSSMPETSVGMLQDTLQAYELQNKFLNKEILELHQLRVEDSLRDDALHRSSIELEAKYYQLHSKYLVVLNELSKPSRDNSAEGRETDELVTQLLQEAIDSETAAEIRERISLTQSGPRMYDRYGFLQENPIAFQVAAAQEHSDRLMAIVRNPDGEPSLRVKWENFLVNMGSQEIHRSIEFKNLIRAGIPHDFRERVWMTCVNFHVSKLKKEKGGQYYQKMLAKHAKNRNRFNPVAKQIELDLPRTLPDNKHFENANADGMQKLRNVLLAYSYHNPDVGYCQGMNRAAAFSLLFLSEEDTFWCLVAIIDYILPPDYYSRSLAGAQADQRVLKDILQEKVPLVASHMERFDLDISLFSFNWFLTLFVENVPIPTVLRIWDAFLFEGSKVLFRFAVAFFKYKEAEILQQCDYLGTNVYMRGLGETMVDADAIANIAFNNINPFMQRSITTKRARYLDQVRAELQEISQMRAMVRSQPREAQEFASDEDEAVQD